MSTHRLSLLSLALLGTGWAAPAAAQLVDADTLPGGTACEATVINNSGTIIGTCNDAGKHYVAFRKLAGQAKAVLPGLAAGKSCSVYDLNNAGASSGSCEDANGEQRAVRWTASGTVQALDPIPGLLGLLADIAADAGRINQNGAIAGTSTSDQGNVSGVVWLAGQTTPQELPMGGLLGIGAVGCAPSDLNDLAAGANGGPVVSGTCDLQQNGTLRAVAVRWKRNGAGNYAITALQPLFPNEGCTTTDINNNGDIVGACSDPNGDTQAVRWLAGGTAPETIETILGAVHSTAASINSQGLVAGTYQTLTGFAHGFLWDPNNDTFEDVPPLPGANSNRAVDLNDNNTIVGTSQTADGHVHAFTWHLDTGTVDLGTLGGFNSGVSDISETGLVVGTSQAADGHIHAFYTE